MTFRDHSSSSKNLPILSFVARDEWQHQSNPVDVFEFMKTLDGEIARAQANRTTLRFQHGDQYYYRKWHQGITLKEVLKNYLQGRAPIVGARNEWDALTRLEFCAIPSLAPVVYGERGRNIFSRESFIVTRELARVQQLDHYLVRQQQAGQLTQRELVLIAAAVGEFTARLHNAGVNHRDLYLCHFLMPDNFVFTGKSPAFHLIDLHRAGVKASVNFRWRVKDVASMYFSLGEVGLSPLWVKRAQITFLKAYAEKIDNVPRLFSWLNNSLPEKPSQDSSTQKKSLRHFRQVSPGFYCAVLRKAAKLISREQRLRERGLR
jgi:heptose I phosphotransferase